MSDLIGEVLHWVESSGRALELRVARTLQREGQATVQPAFNYQDTVTGVSREADVVASFPWTGANNVPCAITVAVECKSSTKQPWVAFYAGTLPSPPGSLNEWAVFAHGPFVGITAPLEGLWTGQMPFTARPVASHIVAAYAKDGLNPASDAVRQALSCAASLRQDYIKNQVTRPVGLVCLAAVVTAAPLLTCRLDGTGVVAVEAVDEVDVWGYGNDGERHRVYVRSERSLPLFAEGLKQRAAQAG